MHIGHLENHDPDRTVISLLAWQTLWIVSLAGFGLVVRRIVGIRSVVNPFGVDVIFGLFAVSGVGALVLHIGIGGPAVWTGMLVAGALAWCVNVALIAGRSAEGRLSRHKLTSFVTNAGCAAIVAPVTIANMLTRVWNPCDDDPAYLYLARRIWMLGNLNDPYNNRRLVSNGAGSMLQALSMGPLPDSTLHSFDEVIGAVLLFSVALSVKGLRPRLWSFALACAVLVAHNGLGLANSSPNFAILSIHLVVFVEVFLGMRLDNDRSAELMRILCISTLLLTMIRPMFGFTMGLFLVWTMYRQREIRWRWINKRTVSLSMSFSALWTVLQVRDVRTPIFPLLNGVASRQFPLPGHPNRTPLLGFLGRSAESLLSTGTSVFLLLVVLVARAVIGVSHPQNSRVRLRRDFYILMAIGTTYYFLFAALTRRTGTPDVYPRFWAPILFGCGLSIIFVASHHGAGRTPELSSIFAVSQLAIVLSTAFIAPYGVWLQFVDSGKNVTSGSMSTTLETDRYGEVRTQYANMRALIPSGARVLSSIQLPHLLLNERYHLFTMDIATANAPNGEFPVDGSLADQVGWVRDQRMDFLVVHSSSTDSCLFSVASWAKNIGVDNTYGDWEPYSRSWIDFTLELPILASPLIAEGDTLVFSVPDLVNSIGLHSPEDV